ncbi:hypothetical protein [Streptomyces atratus]|uniref:hypothetical protein n=1 Tax=Streptomyces atratus TaxID=1893 RepID=UPI0033E37682
MRGPRPGVSRGERCAGYRHPRLPLPSLQPDGRRGVRGSRDPRAAHRAAGFDEVYGSPYVEWLAAHPEAAPTFNKGQAGLVPPRLLPLLESGARSAASPMSAAATARHPAALLDLHMLVLLGGRERTESQWRALLERGGFDTVDIHRGARAALVEAVPR